MPKFEQHLILVVQWTTKGEVQYFAGIIIWRTIHKYRVQSWSVQRTILAASRSSNTVSSHVWEWNIIFGFKSQGIARTQSPSNKNCAPESSTFGMIARVNLSVVQCRGLALGEPPCRSRSPLCQVSMLDFGTQQRSGESKKAAKMVCMARQTYGQGG